MTRIRLKILFVLPLFLLCLNLYNIYTIKKFTAIEALSSSPVDMASPQNWDTSSTKEWQDYLEYCLIKRNDIINGVLDQKYDNVKTIERELKTFEGSPLIDGDISLIEYMKKNTFQFTSRKNNMKVENSQIRQLTENQIALVSRVSYLENNLYKKYQYEVVFRNDDGLWLMTKFTFSN